MFLNQWVKDNLVILKPLLSDAYKKLGFQNSLVVVCISLLIYALVIFWLHKIKKYFMERLLEHHTLRDSGSDLYSFSTFSKFVAHHMPGIPILKWIKVGETKHTNGKITESKELSLAKIKLWHSPVALSFYNIELATFRDELQFIKLWVKGIGENQCIENVRFVLDADDNRMVDTFINAMKQYSWFFNSPKNRNRFQFVFAKFGNKSLTQFGFWMSAGPHPSLATMTANIPPLGRNNGMPRYFIAFTGKKADICSDLWQEFSNYYDMASGNSNNAFKMTPSEYSKDKFKIYLKSLEQVNNA